MKRIRIDEPRPLVRRITLARPEKRNALDNLTRSELFDALHAHDADESVRVTVIRGDGPSFCAGFDLGSNTNKGRPYYTAGGDADWSRHVVEGWFGIWDLAKPVIAQVHGHCLAGGSELATACDLVYVAEDAKIGYPVVRSMSAPDMQYHPWLMGLRNAMEAMLTGDSMSGAEAVTKGFANRAFPLAELEDGTLDIAERVARVPTDLQQLNKRSVHRAMEVMGARTAIRAGTEIQGLGFRQDSAQATFKALSQKALTQHLSERDNPFGDGRTGAAGDGAADNASAEEPSTD